MWESGKEGRVRSTVRDKRVRDSSKEVRQVSWEQRRWLGHKALVSQLGGPEFNAQKLHKNPGALAIPSNGRVRGRGGARKCVGDLVEPSG